MKNLDNAEDRGYYSKIHEGNEVLLENQG